MPSPAPDTDAPLRVLRVVHTLRPDSGGPSESVLQSTRAMLRLGHKVEIATLDKTGGAAAAGIGAPCHAFGTADHGYGRSPGLVPWIRENRGRFDAVLVHGLWKYGGPAVREGLRGSGIPYLVLPHGMLDARLRRVYPVRHLKKQLWWLLSEHRVLRDAAAVCFTCEDERLLARGTFRPYRIRERVVAYGTADPGPPCPARAEAFERAVPSLRGRRFLLFLGRIHHKKGLEPLLEAFAAHRRENPAPPALAIAGPSADPAYAAHLRRLAAGWGLSQAHAGGGEADVTWIPMLRGNARWGALQSCEAFVLLSRQENFGIAVAEALACSRPVLISRDVGIWREVTSGRAGFAAECSAAGGLELLRSWASVSDAGRASMAESARRCFLDRFEITNATRSLVAAIREAIAGTGG